VAGGKPVIAEPGLTPTSPVMVDDPVFVTVVPASTAKGVALPRPTVAWAAPAALENPAAMTMVSEVAMITNAECRPRLESLGVAGVEVKP
jgi:hypothetical protein